jgi:hypothetical protein
MHKKGGETQLKTRKEEMSFFWMPPLIYSLDKLMPCDTD